MPATRRLAIVATVAVTLLFATSGGASTGREGGTFRVVEGGLASTIDPALVQYPPELQILDPACGGLVAFQDKPLPAGLRIVPDLAESLPRISRNRKTYAFQIRKDARYSDGKPVTARDFVHALERILDPTMKSTNVGFFESLVGAQAMLDGRTKKLAGAVARGRVLTLRLTKPVADFVISLAGPIALCAVPPVPPGRSRRREGPAPRARHPISSPNTYRESGSSSRGTASTGAHGRNASIDSSSSSVSTSPLPSPESRTAPPTMPSGRRPTSSTTRPGLRDDTGSTRRGSSSFRHRACACSP